MKVLGKCPQAVKTSYLKTIINSWSTSIRMGEAIKLPCLLVCQGELCDDNLKHYLECDPLWTLATCACGLPSSFLLLPPLERVCLLNKSVCGLELLSVVFRGYHAIKLGQRDLVDYSIAAGNFEAVHDLILQMMKDMWLH